MLTDEELSRKAIEIRNNGAWMKHLTQKTSARPVTSKLYNTGDIVINVDVGKSTYKQRCGFISSIRWSNGGDYGGFLVVTQRGTIATTTAVDFPEGSDYRRVKWLLQKLKFDSYRNPLPKLPRRYFNQDIPPHIRLLLRAREYYSK